MEAQKSLNAVATTKTIDNEVANIFVARQNVQAANTRPNNNNHRDLIQPGAYAMGGGPGPALTEESNRIEQGGEDQRESHIVIAPWDITGSATFRPPPTQVPVPKATTRLQRGSNVPTSTDPGAYATAGLNPQGNNPDASIMWNLGSMPSGDADVSVPLFQDQEEGLVEARAVDDEDPEQVLTVARAVEPKSRNHELVPYRPLGTGLLLVAALCTVVGLFVGIKNSSVSSPEEADTLPTEQPSVPPTVSPSSAPSGTLDILMEDLPNYTLESLRNFSTPQSQALMWLSNHRNITNLPEWRKKQLLALATFFFAFEGDSWRKEIRERWMDDSKEECYWFSTGFGYFNLNTDEYIEYDPFEQLSPCNGHGQFTSLILQDLVLEGTRPSIPPEITWLTSLSEIDLGYNGLGRTFDQLIPKELYQMASLSVLKFGNNHLQGPVPSEFGLMTNMSRILLYVNSLTGSVPSELGLATNLETLDLESNTTSGSLPTELMFMTKLAELWLNGNLFSGTLPIWQMSSLEMILLSGNSLSGSISVEAGHLDSLQVLDLAHNYITGTLPTQIGLMTSLETLYLQDNRLTGVLPHELNASITLRLDGNQFSGTVPPQLCSVLWCDCSGNISLASTCADLKEHPVWPGRFPPPVSADGDTITVMLNIQTDIWPEETEWVWQQSEGNLTDAWKTLQESKGGLQAKNHLHSYILTLTSGAAHKLVVSDLIGDGLMTEVLGENGWITLTGTNETVLYSFTNAEFSKVIVNVSVEWDGVIEVTSKVEV
ncbi:expressed unknown protein [Seminavis robusta]|uniref:L domain-like protein n=1 Tax=Seminavis robusta TaxID=568900 RepID=A0A9N8E297_9STRA|nr:expressed unknown protein [Seminavis robusta]|eukprot:Sro544_g163621.1  (771) ;mRNA; r:6837-9149